VHAQAAIAGFAGANRSCLHAKEGTREEVAKRFKVSLGMVKKLLAQRGANGRFAGELLPLRPQGEAVAGARLRAQRRTAGLPRSARALAHHHDDLLGALGRNDRLTIAGATNAEVFQAYIREILVPTLRSGDIVVMDNLGAHKNARTLELIRQAQAEVRFLPAYSPDLSPIEMMGSEVKALLPKAQARDHTALLAAIASSLAAVSLKNVLGWFAACGYNFI
jgi:hypothetical protein